MKDQIIKIHEEMKKYSIDAGIKPDFYDSVIVEIDEYSEGELKDLLAWLQDIWEKQYRAVEQIKRLLPEHVWQRYELFGSDGFREIQLLKKAQKDLRRIWSKPYRTPEQLKRVLSKKSPIKHKNIE